MVAMPEQSGIATCGYCCFRSRLCCWLLCFLLVFTMVFVAMSMMFAMKAESTMLLQLFGSLDTLCRCQHFGCVGKGLGRDARALVSQLLLGCACLFQSLTVDFLGGQ